MIELLAADDPISRDWVKHRNHVKQCLQLRWKHSRTSTSFGNVDLWHCDDCNVDFVHDWTDGIK